MRQRRLASLLALALCGAALPFACTPAPATPPTAVEPPPSASASASASAAPIPSATASVAAAPSASAPPTCGEKEILDPHGRCVASLCPAGKVFMSDGTCKDPAPCIDGEVMMGACICPHGKTVDETGHCKFSPCPPGTGGGTVFRDDATGDCMECRPGTVPCGDHCCPGGGKRR